VCKSVSLGGLIIRSSKQNIQWSVMSKHWKNLIEDMWCPANLSRRSGRIGSARTCLFDVCRPADHSPLYPHRGIADLVNIGLFNGGAETFVQALILVVGKLPTRRLRPLDFLAWPSIIFLPLPNHDPRPNLTIAHTQLQLTLALTQPQTSIYPHVSDPKLNLEEYSIA